MPYVRDTRCGAEFARRRGARREVRLQVLEERGARCGVLTQSAACAG